MQNGLVSTAGSSDGRIVNRAKAATNRGREATPAIPATGSNSLVFDYVCVRLTKGVFLHFAHGVFGQSI